MTQTAKTAADRQRVESIARRLMPTLTDGMTYGQRSKALIAWRTAIMEEANVSRDRARTATGNVLRRRRG